MVLNPRNQQPATGESNKSNDQILHREHRHFVLIVMVPMEMVEMILHRQRIDVTKSLRAVCGVCMVMSGSCVYPDR